MPRRVRSCGDEPGTGQSASECQRMSADRTCMVKKSPVKKIKSGCSATTFSHIERIRWIELNGPKWGSVI